MKTSDLREESVEYACPCGKGLCVEHWVVMTNGVVHKGDAPPELLCKDCSKRGYYYSDGFGVNPYGLVSDKWRLCDKDGKPVEIGYCFRFPSRGDWWKWVI